LARGAEENRVERKVVPISVAQPSEGPSQNCNTPLVTIYRSLPAFANSIHIYQNPHISGCRLCQAVCRETGMHGLTAGGGAEKPFPMLIHKRMKSVRARHRDRAKMIIKQVSLVRLSFQQGVKLNVRMGYLNALTTQCFHRFWVLSVAPP
jgi:hypothetical protein